MQIMENKETLEETIINKLKNDKKSAKIFLQGASGFNSMSGVKFDIQQEIIKKYINKVNKVIEELQNVSFFLGGLLLSDKEKNNNMEILQNEEIKRLS